MRAIILAAGRGSRMQGLTSDKPKCLVELRGKPLLHRQMDSLKASGIDEIGIVTGYQREQLAAYGLHEFVNEAWQTTNMVASLVRASEWLEQDACIVSYSDIFYEPEAPDLLQKSDADIAVTYDPDWLEIWSKRFEDPLDDAETFRLDGDRIVEIGRKPDTVSEVEGQYMGLLRFSPAGWAEVRRIFDGLPADRAAKLDMTSLLQAIIDAGRVPVTGIAYRGEWGEVDSGEDLAAYTNDPDA
ncbi:NTP transferase domain-containing protein [Minwuia sp.]|uniref:phosphocholine cytidylyltransferase family protein n=1 Tax=Minwuia sp. TaxID=2493630 RepID=UPI003A93E959